MVADSQLNMNDRLQYIFVVQADYLDFRNGSSVPV
jgi:hypothetical protein